MSEPVTAIAVVAELLASTGSLSAPVVPVTVTLPTVVGVPDTVQLTRPPGATSVGGVGVHSVVRPAGRPDTAQPAFVAVIAGAAAFLQVKVPV